jgi:hypothetical protein
LIHPWDVKVDKLATIMVANRLNHRLRKIVGRQVTRWRFRAKKEQEGGRRRERGRGGFFFKDGASWALRRTLILDISSFQSFRNICGETGPLPPKRRGERGGETRREREREKRGGKGRREELEGENNGEGGEDREEQSGES